MGGSCQLLQRPLLVRAPDLQLWRWHNGRAQGTKQQDVGKGAGGGSNVGGGVGVGDAELALELRLRVRGLTGYSRFSAVEDRDRVLERKGRWRPGGCRCCGGRYLQADILAQQQGRASGEGVACAAADLGE